MADLASAPELPQSFITNFTLPRRAVVGRLIQRAIDNSVLTPGLDADLIMDR